MGDILSGSDLLKSYLSFRLLLCKLKSAPWNLTWKWIWTNKNRAVLIAIKRGVAWSFLLNFSFSSHPCFLPYRCSFESPLELPYRARFENRIDSHWGVLFTWISVSMMWRSLIALNWGELRVAPGHYQQEDAEICQGMWSPLCADGPHANIPSLTSCGAA